MFFIGLATDYDGTLATDGRVPEHVVESLRAFRKTGRKLLLLTGRELDDLSANFSDLALFDRIVAENGAVLYQPSTERLRVLAPAPPKDFVDLLRSRGLAPLSVGKVIVATWEPNQQGVLDAIKELGLELQIIFNKGAVMVLPGGVNKASGLAAALAELEASAHNIVGVGDAENDQAFLQACGCAAAVANALPMLKQGVDIVTRGARGEGVIELMRQISHSEASLLPARAGIAIGECKNGEPVNVAPKESILLTGQSGIGKSTIATAMTERMVERSYQFCILDPEGDFDGLAHAICIGDTNTAPPQEEALGLLRTPANNLVVNTLGVPLADRPRYLAGLLPKIAELRAASGHPHWLIVDEAHHVLPTESGAVAESFPRDLAGAVFITVHPDSMSAFALKTVRHVIGCGGRAGEALAAYAKAVGAEPPDQLPECGEDEAIYWDRESSAMPVCMKPRMPVQEHKRHTRKYAEGELPPDRSFYFKGPDGALNLRAQNLMIFAQLAEGIDEETWMFHLRAHDYSRWFCDIIKDDALAAAAEKIESSGASASETRRKICDEIRARYTAPARG